jgi:hypothetical protein
MKDPMQSLICEGRAAQIHKAASSRPVPEPLVPWNGHTDTMIDRFDVLAFMDAIPRDWNEVVLPVISHSMPPEAQHDQYAGR